MWPFAPEGAPACMRSEGTFDGPKQSLRRGSRESWFESKPPSQMEKSARADFFYARSLWCYDSNVMQNDPIKNATQKFSSLIQDQLSRVEWLKQAAEPVDYAKLDRIMIGICPGDGIGRLFADMPGTGRGFLFCP
jgi:hypothetical protein